MRLRMRVLLFAVVLSPFVFAAGWAAWAGVTGLRYGHADAGPAPDPLLAPFMPRFEVAERHERIVAASPASALHAVQHVRLEDSPVVRAIFRARELILRVPPAPVSSTPFLEQVRTIGWGVLDSVPGRERVFGAIAQPWRGDVQFRPLPPGQFAAFDSAGFAKIVWTIAVDSLGPRRSRVRTETRVATTDPASRALFRRYWSVFSPGIVLIRYELLRVIRREAGRREAGEG